MGQVFQPSYEFGTPLSPILRLMPRVAAEKSRAMPIDAPLSVRAAEESRREASREAAHQYLVSRAEARRDTRVEEAKASAAARPTVAERAAEAPPPRPKPSAGGLIIDVLA